MSSQKSVYKINVNDFSKDLSGDPGPLLREFKSHARLRSFSPSARLLSGEFPGHQYKCSTIFKTKSTATRHRMQIYEAFPSLLEVQLFQKRNLLRNRDQPLVGQV